MSPHNSRGRGRTRVYDTSIGSWSRMELILCVTNRLRQSPLRLSLSQETTDFVSACEALHTRLARSGTLTREEKDLIEFSAIDLLSKVKPKPSSSTH